MLEYEKFLCNLEACLQASAAVPPELQSSPSIWLDLDIEPHGYEPSQDCDQDSPSDEIKLFKSKIIESFVLQLDEQINAIMEKLFDNLNVTGLFSL